MPSYDAHRAAKAVFLVSMNNKTATKNSLGSTKNLTQARKDFVSLSHKSTLENRKARLRGNSHTTDDVLEKAIDAIVSSCSTVAWAMRRHVIKPGSKVITTNHEKKIENKEDAVAFLPVLHQLMGKR